MSPDVPAVAVDVPEGAALALSAQDGLRRVPADLARRLVPEGDVTVAIDQVHTLGHLLQNVSIVDHGQLATFRFRLTRT